MKTDTEYKKISHKIFYFLFKQLEGNELTEEQFLLIFKELKDKKELMQLAITFKSIFSRDLFLLLLKELPEDLIKKIYEILFFNSLSFTQKIIYKLFKIKPKQNGNDTKTI